MVLNVRRNQKVIRDGEKGEGGMMGVVVEDGDYIPIAAVSPP